MVSNLSYSGDGLWPNQLNTTLATTTLATAFHHVNNDDTIISIFIVICLINAIYLSAVTCFYTASKREEKLFLKVCNYISATASTFLCSQLTLLVVHNIIFQSKRICHQIYVTNIILGTCVRMMIYLGLWVRQNAINSSTLDISLKEIYLSRVVLFGIIINSFFQIIVLSFIPHQTVPGLVCQAQKAQYPISSLAPVTFSTWIILQLLLLALTLLPFINYLRSSLEIQRSFKKIKTVIIRLCLCAVVCIISDSIFLVIVKVISLGHGFSFVPLCYCCNSAINLYATIFSFVNYKQRLWPFRSPRTKTPSGSFATNCETQN